MTDKKKTRARKVSAKTGMSYQAAVNQLQNALGKKSDELTLREKTAWMLGCVVAEYPSNAAPPSLINAVTELVGPHLGAQLLNEAETYRKSQTWSEMESVLHLNFDVLAGLKPRATANRGTSEANDLFFQHLVGGVDDYKLRATDSHSKIRQAARDRLRHIPSEDPVTCIEIATGAPDNLREFNSTYEARYEILAPEVARSKVLKYLNQAFISDCNAMAWDRWFNLEDEDPPRLLGVEEIADALHIDPRQVRDVMRELFLSMNPTGLE